MPESREIYRRVDLHFHDLRHEAASRWLEAGMSLHHIKALLGHASLSTTDTYLNATKVGLRDAMRRLDARRAEQGARRRGARPWRGPRPPTRCRSHALSQEGDRVVADAGVNPSG